MKSKTLNEIKERFEKLKNKLPYAKLRNTKLQLGKNLEFPNERDMAYCTEEKHPQIFVSSKMKNLLWDNIDAILMHELSHAVLIYRKKDHTEYQTDKFAEKIFKKKIYYDNNNVQTLKKTKISKRPKYLK